MTAPFITLVHSGPRRFFIRWVASNGPELARSSQVYNRRRDAVRCAVLISGREPDAFEDARGGAA